MKPMKRLTLFRPASSQLLRKSLRSFATAIVLVTWARPAQASALGQAQTVTLEDLAGHTHSFLNSTAPQRRLSVFIFLTHDCPIANSYAPEIAKIEKAYQPQGVQFFEVYTEGDLKPAEARAHHTAFQLKGIGLLDPQTRLARKLGATITPEVFLTTAQGTILYHGRIDNTYAAIGVRRQVTTRHDLIDALKATLKGQKPKASKTTAFGCSIILNK
jgi:hypothetical protein